MKSSLASAPGFLLLLGLILAASLRAEDPDPNVPLTPQQVEQLLGPIALYPDALVAIILPASTVPTDIVLAQRYLSGGGDPEKIEYEPWNESVKALARYPMLIQWLDENLAWTRQLGTTFLYQPDEVMNSVQRLRARARANGTLTSTPQQKLLLDGDKIRIVPARPDVIYIPYYDPNLVYGLPGYYGGPPYVTFGLGLPIGFWLSYDFNWRTRVVIVGDRHHNWSEHHDWDRHAGSGGKPYNGNWRPWTPPPGRPPYSPPDSHRSHQDVARPRSVPGAPPYSHGSHPNDSDRPWPEPNSRDSNHNHPPVPGNDPPVANQPYPSGPTHQPPPVPAGNPPGRHDPHGNQPASPPPMPRPDVNNPPASNPPRSPAPTYQPPPPSARPPPPPPEYHQASPQPPMHQANPPPPPPPKDGTREKEPE